MTNDTPPDWVLKEAAKRCAWHPSKTLAQLRGYLASSAAFTELCRAIEQHEAFRQEVSDALHYYFGDVYGAAGDSLTRFFIAKPDPLVAALGDLGWYNNSPAFIADLRTALEARGLEIREKNDG